ncbi:uncharacterized protein A4U43_C07F3570 [Asparagus officinalis]|uniref:ENT domain-containing protein n=1 Tax=Asparagus officinalis TaxID=4686 RepID=A0A5P1EC92_ASPOF|nr:uncharacterized protein LOC109850533 [Asparagus officinalis]XP_020276142.1 uncharacterized protein LOC109850533 [Asparagus officinalis]XP_020276143.1 uncharacterized protein LOC109850533 [Asparagus officinalis]ONK62409.1 uncharacterized protein A4U43_C07F3570 [Asparagus officinalis]
MKFKFSGGSKVEAVDTREATAGSWRCAEIILGNGRDYSAKYDHCSPELDFSAERVPSKDIRPCPPSMAGLRSWVLGDVVEVLEDSCWKPAQILKVVGENYFIVRLLGSSREVRAFKSNLRLQQSWKDNTWTMIEKEYGEDYDEKVGSLSKVEKFKSGKIQLCMKRCTGNDHFLNKNDSSVKENYQVSSRVMKKRMKLCSHNFEEHTGATKKMRTVMEGKHQKTTASYFFQLPQTVDAVNSPKIMFGDTFMHDSFENGRSQFPEMGMHGGNPNDDVVQFSVGSFKPSYSESFSSSVGSSSPSYSPFRSRMPLKTGSTQDLSIHSEDAEGRLGGNIHPLELNAYRSTLVALYASGPLSWEQEALLTNLRLMLHVTNDEHLFELKHLATIKCN